jgi:FkbM family methyltransferase
MNSIERRLDGLDPRLSVRLRRLKKRWHHDPTLRIMSVLVGEGDVTVDIGANRGVYSLELSRRVGQTGCVHAFDPYPVNVRSLERLSSSSANIIVHPIALSDRAGFADLYVPLHAGQRVDTLATLAAPPAVTHETMQVAVGILDDVLGGDRPSPRFIKCDVEGHEASVLRGGRKLITEQLPTLLVEIEQRHRRDDVHSTFDELLSRGYAGYAVREGRLTSLADFDLERDQLRFLTQPVPTDHMPQGYVGNFLFVRPGTDLGPLSSG